MKDRRAEAIIKYRESELLRARTDKKNKVRSISNRSVKSNTQKSSGENEMKIIDPDAEILMLDKNIKATVTKLLREKTVEHVILSCKSLLSETAIKLLNKQLNTVDLTDAQIAKLKTLLR